MGRPLWSSGALIRALAIATVLTAPAVPAGKTGLAPASAAETASQPAPLRFFAVGDLPYSASEVAPLQALLAAAAAERPPFIVHVGDIKSGSSPCTDEQLQGIAEIFRNLPVPVVYTPGDNEWTDCHRPGAGALDPRARLARVREVFFGDPAVLRLDALGAIRAGRGFPEIYGFVTSGVLFVALHVVGSNNGFDADDPAAIAEFAARDAANQAFLTRMLGSPAARDARALVLLIQANPLFDVGRGPRGFRGFKDQLVRLMGQFPGPVLLIHGDTHRFRHDYPLLDPVRGVPFERFTRVEVPGSPLVGGVWITVDPAVPEAFAVAPVYTVSLERWGN